MQSALDPGLLRDLTEAKAAVARHGIVIIRTIETELEPAIISSAKATMASSPRNMAKMKDDELDRFTDGLRKAAMKSCSELKDTYTRLLTRLGTENMKELEEDLEGIGALFSWDRISKASEDVDKRLAENGFSPAKLQGPSDVSENFQIELEQKWPEAFSRFKELASRAASEIRNQEEQEKAEVARPKKRARGR